MYHWGGVHHVTFLSNYVLLPRSRGSRQGYLEFIPPLLAVKMPAKHFRYAYFACALVSLSGRLEAASDIEKRALALYTKALSLTTIALQSPETARLDATLAAVYLSRLSKTSLLER